MDQKILEYRKTHPKCKFCKYLKLHCGEAATDFYSFWECQLKDKVIVWNNLPTLCRYYTIKEENKYEKNN